MLSKISTNIIYDAVQNAIKQKTTYILTTNDYRLTILNENYQNNNWSTYAKITLSVL